MQRRISVIIAVLAALTLLLSLCGCGLLGKKDANDEAERETSVSDEKLSELGGDFLADLQRKILPNREAPENIPDHGYLVVTGGATYGVDGLTDFFEAYHSNNDGQVTMVFADSSFVVVRLVFESGVGYRLRYEYDKFNPGDVSITGDSVDQVDLEYQSSPPKWTLKLFAGKKQLAVFEFKNPGQRESEA